VLQETVLTIVYCRGGVGGRLRRRSRALFGGRRIVRPGTKLGYDGAGRDSNWVGDGDNACLWGYGAGEALHVDGGPSIGSTFRGCAAAVG